MLSRIIKALKLRMTTPHSWEYFKTLLLYDYPREVKMEGKKLQLLRFELLLEPGKGLPLLKNYPIAVQLTDNLGAKFTFQNDDLLVTFKEYTFQVQTAEDIFILNEVYVEGSYNFIPAGITKEFIVIDIGMNVGFASVFFARHPSVRKVYSFEPFTPTYQQATRHISLNGLENKISAFNYGIGGDDRVLEVDYTPEFRGQVGIHGTGLIRSALNTVLKEKIVIKGIVDEINKITSEHPDCQLVFKIDCEGAEYEIMEKLPAAVFAATSLLMIEWHEKGPDSLNRCLQEHGFTCFSFNASSKKVGMIYAVKQG